MSSPSSKLLLLGQIGAAHGIKGEVRITTHTEHPENIAGYGPLVTNRPGLTVVIKKARQQGNVIVATLEGVADRNAAERLNGVELYVERDRLPPPEDEDDFYHADLIGLEARLESGIIIGKVAAIHNHGAGDIIEVQDEASGDSFLYPFTKAVVPDVRLAEGYLTIVVPLDAPEGEEEPD